MLLLIPAACAPETMTTDAGDALDGSPLDGSPLDAGLDAGLDGGVDPDAGQGPDAGPRWARLEVTVLGEGRVVGGPIRCDGSVGEICAATVAAGTAVTLEASADASWSLESWSTSACAGTRCVVTVDSDLSIEARFVPTPRTLTVDATGMGSATIRSSPAGIDCGTTCAATFPHGTPVTLTVTPGDRSTFDGWAGACAGAGTCTVVMDADQRAEARVTLHPASFLSATDRDPDLRLRPDGLGVDFYLGGGVRSERGIAPGSGVFYFEVTRLTEELGAYSFGVGTALEPLVGDGVYVGASDQSFGADAGGGMFHDGTWLGGFSASENHRTGFVVDYRGASPTVHLIGIELGVPSLLHTQPMPAVTTPLHVFLAGSKRTFGWELEVNLGNQTTVFPFAFDPKVVLRAAGETAAASALLMGFGDTFVGPPDDAPALSVSMDGAVAAGAPVTVTALATDREDGDLSAQIEWELLSTPYYAGRVTGVGPSFTFTPTAVGLHPARATVRDSAGVTTEATVMVRVAGPVAQHDPVRLVPDALSGAGIVLSPDGLDARWTGLGKMGVRANQAIYGRFWYFEIVRHVPPRNQGGGLVTADGNLNPYSWLDTPQSCSINNGGGVWRNIIWQTNFPDPDPSTYARYGFAVDYRGLHPIVYVIVGDAVVSELHLDDVWTALRPMLYGNPSSTLPGDWDEGIRFEAPFSEDARAALVAHGVDVSAFELGWGDASLPP